MENDLTKKQKMLIEWLVRFKISGRENRRNDGDVGYRRTDRRFDGLGGGESSTVYNGLEKGFNSSSRNNRNRKITLKPLSENYNTLLEEEENENAGITTFRKRAEVYNLSNEVKSSEGKGGRDVSNA